MKRASSKPRLRDLLPRGSRGRAAGLVERIRALPTSSSRMYALAHLPIRRVQNGLADAIANLQTHADAGNIEAKRKIGEIEAKLAEEEVGWIRRRAGEDPIWNTWRRIRANAQESARLRRVWKVEWEATWDDPPDDPEEELDAFRDWAGSSYGVGVDDETGLATFDRRTREVEILLDGLDVAVYHHTTSKLVSRIRKQGLESDRKRSSPYKNSGAGVYVTTETSGRAVEGYGAAAATRHGGRPVMLTIRTRLHDLDDDPDDQELAFARGRQFVLPRVDPGDVVSWGPG